MQVTTISEATKYTERELYAMPYSEFLTLYKRQSVLTEERNKALTKT